ncbi:MAG: LysR family transcriptional regulator [Proteobacteria bacterium]|nr:LysR family transcriptional regulator [Pseudomonadota bacterium]
MSRWDLMQSFVQVVDAGSFSAAAERMQVSKSLLSKNVARLERHLGTQLLVRTTRRLNPTDAGAALFQKCERLFNDLEEAEQSVLSLDVKPRGHLRVVCTDVLGEQYVARAAAAMCALHPQLKVDVHVTMRTVDLVAEGYDLAIRYGELTDSSLKARKVYELPHVVCASPEYFAKHGRPETIEDLRQHNCIVATFDPCTTWHFKVDGRDIPIDLQGNWRSNSGSALVTAAAEGVGICRLPLLYVRDFLNSGRLIAVLEEFRSDPLPVWMVYPNARYVPAKVRFFIDYFCDNIERLAQL